VALRYPLALYVAHAVQAVPIVAIALVWGRRPPAPYLLLSVWCGMLVLDGALEMMLGSRGHQNLWLGWIFGPAEVSLTLWFLSYWHRAGWLRRAYRQSVVVILLLTPAVHLMNDPTEFWEMWVGPLFALTCFVAAVHTLLESAIGARVPLTMLDRFWVCLGLGVFWVTFVPLPPFAYALVNTRTDWIILAYIIRAWVKVAGLAFVVTGIYVAWSQKRLAGLS
jgi:hypothetical protein